MQALLLHKISGLILCGFTNITKNGQDAQKIGMKSFAFGYCLFFAAVLYYQQFQSVTEFSGKLYSDPVGILLAFFFWGKSLARSLFRAV